MKKKILGIITARGGSKRVRRKNIREIFGKPLLAWTIQQAKGSKYIDRLIVSTDDEETANIARKYSGEAPFLRPKEFATDEAKSIDVIIHAVNWSKECGDNYEIVILLQPTSPMRLTEDIDKAVELLCAKKAKAVVSVCAAEHPPCWTNTLPADGSMKAFIKPEMIMSNRQEPEKYYRLNGAVYVAYIDYLTAQNGFFGDETFAYIMPGERSVDIDNEIDFKFAEYLMKMEVNNGKDI